MIAVRPVRPTDPEVAALLRAHAAHCDGASPPESTHYLAAEALGAPGITLLGAYAGDDLLSIGALREGVAEGEIKSMHTAAAARGRGAARAILDALIALAIGRGLPVLRLETGTASVFAPARALYARAGFAPRGPFPPYVEDPESAFFEKKLTTVRTPDAGGTPAGHLPDDVGTDARQPADAGGTAAGQGRDARQTPAAPAALLHPEATE